MCNWRNTTITTITIITIISGAGIGTTTIIITTIIIAIIDGREDADIKQDPLGSCSFWKSRADRKLRLARLFFGCAMKMPIGAVEDGVR